MNLVAASKDSNQPLQIRNQDKSKKQNKLLGFLSVK